MNERIKQLMIEAGYAAPEMAGRAQKFADLLLFECIKLAIFEGDTTTGRAIKEHFGVEEYSPYNTTNS